MCVPENVFCGSGSGGGKAPSLGMHVSFARTARGRGRVNGVCEGGTSRGSW